MMPRLGTEHWWWDSSSKCSEEHFMIVYCAVLSYILWLMFCLQGSETRQISQYHFLTWPDFGVPEDMEHILTFVKDIRNSIRGTAPVLVHCRWGYYTYLISSLQSSSQLTLHAQLAVLFPQRLCFYRGSVLSVEERGIILAGISL